MQILCYGISEQNIDKAAIGLLLPVARDLSGVRDAIEAERLPRPWHAAWRRRHWLRDQARGRSEHAVLLVDVLRSGLPKAGPPRGTGVHRRARQPPGRAAAQDLPPHRAGRGGTRGMAAKPPGAGL